VSGPGPGLPAAAAVHQVAKACIAHCEHDPQFVVNGECYFDGPDDGYPRPFGSRCGHKCTFAPAEVRTCRGCKATFGSPHADTCGLNGEWPQGRTCVTASDLAPAGVHQIPEPQEEYTVCKACKGTGQGRGDATYCGRCGGDGTHPAPPDQHVDRLGCAAHGFKFHEDCDACESGDQYVAPPRIWIEEGRISYPSRYFYTNIPPKDAIEYLAAAPIQAALERLESGATEIPAGSGHYRRSVAANDRVEVNKLAYDALVALVKGGRN